MSSHKGILIVVEGIDGSGKSTLARNLTTLLQNQGHDVLLTKEPGGTLLGQRLRSIVQERTFSIIPKAEFLLFAADRAQHRAEVIEPALAQNKIVISDRMGDSSLVYQGYGRGLDRSMIATINAWAMNNAQPQVTFFVNVDVQTAFTRIVQRNLAKTAFEQETYDFFSKLVHGFQEIYSHRTDVVTLDGLQTPETLSHQALTKVTSIVREHYRLNKIR